MVAAIGGHILANAQKGSFVAIAAIAGYRFNQQRACDCETLRGASNGSTSACPGVVMRSHPSTPSSLTCGNQFHEVRFGELSKLFFHNSVLLVPDMLSKAECELLLQAAEAGAAMGAGRLRPGTFKQDPWKAIQRLAAKRGLWSLQQFEPLERMPMCDLSAEAQELSTTLLRDRLLPFLEQHLPAVTQELFGRSSDLRTLRFSFSPHEPAINRYTSGGKFRVHTDDRSVTLYVLLSDVDDFTGGGTAFWCQGRRPEDVRDTKDELEEELLLLPGRGMGVIFNGNISHAGKVVKSGTRYLYVASFDLQPSKA